METAGHNFMSLLKYDISRCGRVGPHLIAVLKSAHPQPPCFSDNNGFWKMSISCKTIHSNSTWFFTNFTVLVPRPNPTVRIELASPIEKKERSLSVVASTAINILLIQDGESCCAFSISGFLSQKIRRDSD